MKTIRSFVKTYIAAFGLISLPFFILIVLSYWILVNPEVIVYGLTFSFLSSFLIAYNFRKYEKSVAFTDETLFVNDLINSLSKLGYIVKDKSAGSIELEPTVHSHLFAGNILIHLSNNSATFEGSRLLVRKGLALTLNKNQRTPQSTPIEECVSVWAEGNQSPDSGPVLGDYFVNSSEFAQAEERMIEISANMPEKD